MSTAATTENPDRARGRPAARQSLPRLHRLDAEPVRADGRACGVLGSAEARFQLPRGGALANHAAARSDAAGRSATKAYSTNIPSIGVLMISTGRSNARFA